jgi:hypothetical protein
MSVEVECAACFNRGGGAGWVARTTHGTVHWLCPACVASDSQPVPVVSTDDLARLTQSQAQRAVSVCPKCGAVGPAGKCPLCQLRREARARTIKLLALSFTIVVAVHLACGVLGGVAYVNMTRAIAAALGGALPAGVVVAFAVTGFILAREGHQGWLAASGRYLLLAALLCALLGCAVAFLPFAFASQPLLRIFGEAALYVIAAAAVGALLQRIAMTLGIGRPRQALDG